MYTYTWSWHKCCMADIICQFSELAPYLSKGSSFIMSEFGHTTYVLHLISLYVILVWTNPAFWFLIPWPYTIITFFAFSGSFSMAGHCLYTTTMPQPWPWLAWGLCPVPCKFFNSIEWGRHQGCNLAVPNSFALIPMIEVPRDKKTPFRLLLRLLLYVYNWWHTGSTPACVSNLAICILNLTSNNTYSEKHGFQKITWQTFIQYINFIFLQQKYIQYTKYIVNYLHKVEGFSCGSRHWWVPIWLCTRCVYCAFISH